MTSFDELDLVAQLRVCARVLSGVGASFRDIDRPAMGEQCVTLAIWFADLAHDLDALLEDP